MATPIKEWSKLENSRVGVRSITKPKSSFFVTYSNGCSATVGKFFLILTSPDLAPSDFHLFGPLKRHLGGMAFETENDLISEWRNMFDNLDVDFFRVGINSLLSRWQKCIDLHGDYVEK
ncbi:histone-lysine N-methyltransferase SETMAR [Plakobranchus ocellatus]|uniref:Histone-lysine N-methyltransferase SETMAR n=1 Tax=Plakobranchus ocellatus TaxID=259542 RepID=A0AAV3ZKW5_9GAST|nr:histone-lysine N-methyltransferase SETMAR [Plakobranchus ocellatus]